MMEYLVILPTFFIVIISLLLYRRSKSNDRNKLPPGPWKLPLIGSLLHLVGPLPHHTLKNLASKHGPVMHLQLGQISAVVISSPSMAKEAMKTNDLALADRPSLLIGEILGYNYKGIAFSRYNESWRQLRKICTLELLSSKKVRSFRWIREEEVRDLVRFIHDSESRSINLSEKIYSFMNVMVCRSLFGSKCEEQDSLIKGVKEGSILASGFDAADLFPSFKLLHSISSTRSQLEKLLQNFDRIFENIINDRLNQASSVATTGDQEEDLLDVLLRLKNDGRPDFSITQINIKAVLLDMLGAGTDTSSSTAEWAMAEMIRNPQVMEKAQSELRQTLKGKEEIYESDIQEVVYLKLVIKETLRLHPPAPLLFPLECREECEIGEYTIPVKTKVITNAWAIGRDPEYWEEPDSFYPERFENSDVDFLGKNYEYIPFGAGRRICPGMNFGMATLEIILANLLYHFDWKLPNGMNSNDIDMTESFGVTAKKRDDLYLIAMRHLEY